jgi:hypothetical protein
VTILLKQASSDVICELYDRKHAPKLGQGIYIAIQMAQWEKLRPLRYNSLFCPPYFQYSCQNNSPEVSTVHSFGMSYWKEIPKLHSTIPWGSVRASTGFVTVDFMQ